MQGWWEGDDINYCWERKSACCRNAAPIMPKVKMFFCFWNIEFDVRQRTRHATIQMVFQFQLPKSLSAIKSETLTRQYNQFEVGASEFVWVDSTMFHNIENLITNFEDNEADERLYSNYTITIHTTTKYSNTETRWSTIIKQ